MTTQCEIRQEKQSPQVNLRAFIIDYKRIFTC